MDTIDNQTLLISEVIRLQTISSAELDLGRKARFGCLLLSGDNAEFVWTKDGHLFSQSSSNRIIIQTLPVMSTLTVGDLRQSDSGLYTCIAKNAISEDRQEARLHVRGEYNDVNSSSKRILKYRPS